MADTKLSALTELTTVDNADVGYIVDVSDTTQGLGGTAKKVTKSNLLKEVNTAITSHTSNTSNPHSVTKTQVGLGNVDNTSDLNKPISTATQSALDGKSSTSHNHDGVYAASAHNHTGTYEPANANIQSQISSTSNPHSVTAAQAGAIATGGAYSDLSTASKIGTGSTQVAAGDHNHTGTYEPASADFTSKVSAASDTAAGKVELATTSETSTGTDTGRAVTPDGLAGSNFGIRYVQITCFDYATDIAIGDGKGYFVVPAALNGMNLVSVHAKVITAGTTGTSDIQIANVTDTQDMLSTKCTIDSGETGSDTAATAAVINTSYDDVATNDLLRIDVDAASTTKPKGLIVTLGFQLP